MHFSNIVDFEMFRPFAHFEFCGAFHICFVLVYILQCNASLVIKLTFTVAGSFAVKGFMSIDFLYLRLSNKRFFLPDGRS